MTSGLGWIVDHEDSLLDFVFYEKYGDVYANGDRHNRDYEGWGLRRESTSDLAKKYSVASIIEATTADATFGTTLDL
jgi:hypothetical protein